MVPERTKTLASTAAHVIAAALIGERFGLLDENRAWPYSRGMIDAATILIVRRRRSLAVRAVVCV